MMKNTYEKNSDMKKQESTAPKKDDSYFQSHQTPFNQNNHHDENKPDHALHTFDPSTVIHVTDEMLTVYLELPGVSEKDISIECISNYLIIKGEKKPFVQDCKPNSCWSKQYWAGSFKSVINLNRWVDKKDITAQLEKGVLCINVKYSSTLNNQSDRIEITTG